MGVGEKERDTVHRSGSSKAAAVQRCQLVATLDRHSGTGGVQKCMQTGN